MRQHRWLLLGILSAARCVRAHGPSGSRSGFDRFGQTYIINLQSRPDRLDHVLNVVRSLNVTRYTVIPAVPHPCGSLGCSVSHLFALEACMASQAPTCLVLEDDFSLRVSPDAAAHAVDTFFGHVRERALAWDVLLMSGSVLKGRATDFAHVSRVLDAQTTSGYAFTQRYARQLLRNFLHSARRLNEQCPTPEYSLDIYWKRLQRAHDWFILNPVVGTQMASYSDIERKDVDYGV